MCVCLRIILTTNIPRFQKKAQALPELPSPLDPSKSNPTPRAPAEGRGYAPARPSARAGRGRCCRLRARGPCDAAEDASSPSFTPSVTKHACSASERAHFPHHHHPLPPAHLLRAEEISATSLHTPNTESCCFCANSCPRSIARTRPTTVQLPAGGDRQRELDVARDVRGCRGGHTPILGAS